MKYVLHLIEIRTGEQWENKGVFMLYSDLILGFLRLGLYLIFIVVMMKIHTFPLFAIRPMFIAMR
jgi:E3 ubiquitin-protein ligase synoviolin